LRRYFKENSVAGLLLSHLEDLNTVVICAGSATTTKSRKPALNFNGWLDPYFFMMSSNSWAGFEMRYPAWQINGIQNGTIGGLREAPCEFLAFRNDKDDVVYVKISRMAIKKMNRIR